MDYTENTEDAHKHYELCHKVALYFKKNFPNEFENMILHETYKNLGLEDK